MRFAPSGKTNIFNPSIVNVINKKIGKNKNFPFAGFKDAILGVDYSNVYSSMKTYAGCNFGRTDYENFGIATLILARLRLCMGADIKNIHYNPSNNIYKISFNLDKQSKTLIYAEHEFGRGTALIPDLLDDLQGLLLKGVPRAPAEIKKESMASEINNISLNVKGTIVIRDSYLPKKLEPYISIKIPNVYNNPKINFYVLESKNLPDTFKYIKHTPFRSKLEDFLVHVGQYNGKLLIEYDSDGEEKHIMLTDSKTKNFNYVEYTKGIYLGVGTSTVCEFLDDHLIGQGKDWGFYLNDFMSRSLSNTFHFASMLISFSISKKLAHETTTTVQMATNLAYKIIYTIFYNEEINLPQLATTSAMMLSPGFVLDNPVISGYASTVFEKGSCEKLVIHLGENALSNSNGILDAIAHTAGEITEYLGNLICDSFNIC